MDIITYALLKGKIKKASEELSQLEQEVDILNGDSSTPGSVQYQIAEVIAGAPEEYNTLLEIAQWLSEHEDDYAAVIEDIINLKAQKTALKNADGTYNSELTIGEGLTVVNNILKLNPIQVTQAEYDALTPEEQNNGTVYYIIDAGSSGDIAAGTAITITVMQDGTKRISVELADDVSDDELPITSKAVKDALAAQQLTAGTNISIDNGVISATDTKYTAGANISIDANNVISADAAAYTAGTNISIDNNVISATDTTYTAGSNITIDTNNEISATDTVYTAGNGITINNNNEIIVDNPIPSATATDAGKVLMVNSQGTWVATDTYSDTIIFTYDEDTGELTCNKTNAQLLDANVHDKFELVVTPKIAGATPETIENLYQVVTKTDSIAFVFVAPNKVYSINVDASTMGVNIVNTKVTGGDNVTLTYDEATDSLQISTNANTNKVEITQAEYNALPTAIKKNGSVYFITDAGSEGGGSYSAGTGIDITNNVISIAPDTDLSSISENAVQNKVVAEALEAMQPALTAGTNITIDNNTISATDTTYSAGTGINIDNNNHINNLFTVNNDVLTYNGITINPKTEATAVTYATTTNVSDALNNVTNNINNVATVVNGHTTQIQNLQGSLSTATTAIGDLTTAVSDINGKFGDYLPKTNPIYNGTFSTNTSNALGNGSIALGYDNSALGVGSIAIGNSTTSDGESSFALGIAASAVAKAAFAEGRATTASAQYAHAEGYQTKAAGDAAHAEGLNTYAAGYYSHAEGYGSQATAIYTHAEGQNTSAYGDCSHTEGNATYTSTSYAHAEGYSSSAIGTIAHAEGNSTKAIGESTHSEGEATTASGVHAHAEGWSTRASGNHSHSEGWNTTASGLISHAEGVQTHAADYGAHVEGHLTTATRFAHAEGEGSYAASTAAHAEGLYTTASNACSHTEGHGTYAGSTAAHAEGYFTRANGLYSHAEGIRTTANGDYSHAGGYYTIASENYQTAIGKFNAIASNALFIIGNGTSAADNEINLSNAFTVDVDGNVAIAGDLTLNNGTAAVTVADKLLPATTIADAGKILAVDDNGQWGAQPFHKYSTTEQVVGEWIDGRPVYEITLTVAATTQVSDVAWAAIPFIETVPSGIDKLIDAIYTGSVPNKSSIRFYFDGSDICGASDHSPHENIAANDNLIFRYIKTV